MAENAEVNRVPWPTGRDRAWIQTCLQGPVGLQVLQQASAELRKQECGGSRSSQSTYRKYMESSSVNAGTIGEHHGVAEAEYHKSVGSKTKENFP